MMKIRRVLFLDGAAVQGPDTRTHHVYPSEHDGFVSGAHKYIEYSLVEIAGATFLRMAVSAEHIKGCGASAATYWPDGWEIHVPYVHVRQIFTDTAKPKAEGKAAGK